MTLGGLMGCVQPSHYLHTWPIRVVGNILHIDLGYTLTQNTLPREQKPAHMQSPRKRFVGYRFQKEICLKQAHSLHWHNYFSQPMFYQYY
jgi:hypothetical protein